MDIQSPHWCSLAPSPPKNAKNLLTPHASRIEHFEEVTQVASQSDKWRTCMSHPQDSQKIDPYGTVNNEQSDKCDKPLPSINHMSVFLKESCHKLCCDWLISHQNSHIRLSLVMLKSLEENVIMVFLLSVLPSFCIRESIHHLSIPFHILGTLIKTFFLFEKFSNSCNSYL